MGILGTRKHRKKMLEVTQMNEMNKKQNQNQNNNEKQNKNDNRTENRTENRSENKNCRWLNQQIRRGRYPLPRQSSNLYIFSNAEEI